MLLQLAQLIARSARWRHALFAVLTVVTVAVVGYHYGTFDQSIHIPFLKKYVDPTLFPNDLFFEMRHQHYSYFWFLFQPVYQAGGETALILTLFVSHLAVTYLTFWVYWLLVEMLLPTPLARLFGLVGLAIPHLGFAAFPIIEFSLLNRTFALPFMLLALVVHLRGHTFWALALLGVMFNFHVLSVQFVLPLLLLDSVLRLKQVGWLKLAAGLVVFGLGTIPVLLWKASGPPVDFSVRPEWFNIIASGMFAHLFFVIASYPYVPLITLCGLSALGLYLIARQAHPTWPHRAAVTHFVIAVLLVIGVQSLLMSLYPITIVAQAQVMRIGLYVTLLGYLYFAGHLAELWEQRALAPLDFGLLTAATLSPLPPVALGVWAVQHFARAARWQRLATGATLVALTTFAFAVPMAYDIWGPGISVFPAQTPWVQMQHKAKAVSAKEALFITPPEIWWFYTPDWRVFSERSTVVTLSELLEIALVPDNITQWRARMDDFAPGAVAQFNGNFFDNRAFVHAAFYQLTTADFARLAAKYGASYLVVEKPYTYDFPVICENTEFVLYQLDATQPVPACPAD